MNVDQTEQDDRLLLTITGKCTVENAVALRDALLAATQKPKDLALDISSVESADITFLQLLLATERSLAKRGTHLMRAGALSEAVGEAARVSGFDQTPRLKTFFSDEGRDG